MTDPIRALERACGPTYRGRYVDEIPDKELASLIAHRQFKCFQLWSILNYPRDGRTDFDAGDSELNEHSPVSAEDAAARIYDHEYPHLWNEMLRRDIWPWPSTT